MKVLLDTNVVLDAIASREPFRENAEKIFLLAAEETIEGYITANSVTDIYCIAQKSLSDFDAREALRHLLQIFFVISVHGKDLETALDLPIADFEDAVVVCCAHKAEIDYIITRDEGFMKVNDTISVISPTLFLDKVFK